MKESIHLFCILIKRKEQLFDTSLSTNTPKMNRIRESIIVSYKFSYLKIRNRTRRILSLTWPSVSLPGVKWSLSLALSWTTPRLLLFKTSRTKVLQTLAIRLSRRRRLGRSPLKSHQLGNFLVKSLLKFSRVLHFHRFPGEKSYGVTLSRSSTLTWSIYNNKICKIVLLKWGENVYNTWRLRCK